MHHAWHSQFGKFLRLYPAVFGASLILREKWGGAMAKAQRQGQFEMREHMRHSGKARFPRKLLRGKTINQSFRCFARLPGRGRKLPHPGIETTFRPAAQKHAALFVL